MYARAPIFFLVEVVSSEWRSGRPPSWPHRCMDDVSSREYYYPVNCYGSSPSPHVLEEILGTPACLGPAFLPLAPTHRFPTTFGFSIGTSYRIAPSHRVVAISRGEPSCFAAPSCLRATTTYLHQQRFDHLRDLPRCTITLYTPRAQSPPPRLETLSVIYSKPRFDRR